jgi:hypothetical protein
MTAAVTMMMTMTMLAQAAVLDVARLLTRATHKEVQGVHRGTKHHLQVVQRRAKVNVLLRHRSLQMKRGHTLEPHPGELSDLQYSKRVPILNDVQKV